MHLQTLKLTNFRNYTFQELAFSDRLNCFVGKNGMGKTNLLDAIYYLCMCKSNLGINDINVVRFEESFFRLEGLFELAGKNEKIVAKVMPRKKKDIERNDNPYKKLSEHIGLLPVVIIVPDDTMLATGGSEDRRRFLDNTISQLESTYLDALITYNKVLKQRNAALKEAGKTGYFNHVLIATYNEQLLEPSAIIYKKRQQFIEQFIPFLEAYYKSICTDNEKVNITYESALHQGDMETWLVQNAEKDRIMQRTTAGIHRDDLAFEINGHPLKRFASQGQLKSFVLALKLAQYELLYKEKGQEPILLLDDIFDKLDSYRVGRLLELLLDQHFGQVFITDTHESRIASIVEGFKTNFKKFVIQDGEVVHSDNEVI